VQLRRRRREVVGTRVGDNTLHEGSVGEIRSEQRVWEEGKRKKAKWWRGRRQRIKKTRPLIKQKVNKHFMKPRMGLKALHKGGDVSFWVKTSEGQKQITGGKISILKPDGGVVRPEKRSSGGGEEKGVLAEHETTRRFKKRRKKGGLRVGKETKVVGGSLRRSNNAERTQDKGGKY